MKLKSLTIEHFRGIEKLELEFDQITVLIGENNTGKTSVLEALTTCLGRGSSRRAVPFAEYDYHLKDKAAEPTAATPISLLFVFREEKADEWPEAITQALNDVAQARTDGLSEVRLRFTSGYDSKLKDFVYEWSFLDLNNNPLAAKTRRLLQELQQLAPVFFLTAIRDAGKQFEARSQFWGAFVRNLQLDETKRKELEDQIEAINKAVLDCHRPFDEVKTRLSRTAKLVPLDQDEGVSVEAVPARVFDILSRTQVKLAATTGAKLPIGQHGAGTQSLAVMFLFEAFLIAKLAEAYDKNSEPLLALEEPESHLHPSAIRCLWDTLNGLRGQKVVATHSGDLLSSVPLKSIRRLARKAGKIKSFSVQDGHLTAEEERQLSYTIRAQRGSLMFARTWLLVEGATEFWFLPAAARYLNIDLDMEGISLIEIAQLKGGCTPLVKLANALGIEWHLLADGDHRGGQYKDQAINALDGQPEADRVTRITEKDIEHCLWSHGFSAVYEAALKPGQRANIHVPTNDPTYPGIVLGMLDKQKPMLAVAASDLLLNGPNSPGVPASLKAVLETVQRLARR